MEAQQATKHTIGAFSQRHLLSLTFKSAAELIRRPQDDITTAPLRSRLGMGACIYSQRQGRDREGAAN